MIKFFLCLKNTFIFKIKNWKLVFICNNIGHNYQYSFHTNDGEKKYFRVCKRCHQLQDYRELPDYRNNINNSKSKAWITLVSYTKKGAKKHLSNIIENYYYYQN